jgi:DNA-directed RNA polymerase subunit beta'
VPRPGETKLVKTTTGRVLLYEHCPPEIPFSAVNKVMGKKQLADLIDLVYRLCGQKTTVILADHLRTLGYTEATKAGISICIDDMRIPKRKHDLLSGAQKEVTEIEDQYTEGLITDGERYNKVVDIWAQVAEQIAQEMMSEIGSEEAVDELTGEKRKVPSFNPIYIMADSGARGSAQQIRQLAGMRGLMAKPSGEIIETPITTNFREGLSVLQYFISTHGARKGLADTGAQDRQLGLPDPPPRRRRAGRDHRRLRLRHDGGHRDERPGRGRRDHRAPRRPHPRPHRARGRRRSRTPARSSSAPTTRSPRTR